MARGLSDQPQKGVDRGDGQRLSASADIASGSAVDYEQAQMIRGRKPD
jgi:hypothetical protein